MIKNNTKNINEIKNEVIELNLLNNEAMEKLEADIANYSKSIELFINVPEGSLSEDIKKVL